MAEQRTPPPTPQHTLAKGSEERFAASMRPEVERLLAGVMRAVNDAPDGAWIEASEMVVRDLFADLRRSAYEAALQARVDAAEASFSPSGGGGTQGEGQGAVRAEHADGRRAGGRPADAVVGRRARRGGSGRRR